MTALFPQNKLIMSPLFVSSSPLTRAALGRGSWPSAIAAVQGLPTCRDFLWDGEVGGKRKWMLAQRLRESGLGPEDFRQA